MIASGSRKGRMYAGAAPIALRSDVIETTEGAIADEARSKACSRSTMASGGSGSGGRGAAAFAFTVTGGDVGAGSWVVAPCRWHPSPRTKVKRRSVRGRDTAIEHYSRRNRGDHCRGQALLSLRDDGLRQDDEPLGGGPQ